MTDQIAETEIQYFESFSEIYKSRNPVPQEPTYMMSFGIEWWTILITSVAALFLNALRTGTAFYGVAIATTGIPEVYRGGVALLEAIVAVVAYEGLIFGVGVFHGSRQRSINPIVKWSAAGIAIATSFIAAAYVSLDGLGLDVTGVKTSLGVAMTLGSLLALASGEMLGSLVGEAKGKYENSIDQYQKDVVFYNDRLKRSWVSNRTKFLAHHGIVVSELARKEVAQPQINETISRRIRAYIVENGLDLDSVRPVEIARSLEINPSTARVELKRLRDER